MRLCKSSFRIFCFLLSVIVLITPGRTYAQDTLNISFGNISEQDFARPDSLLDSSAGAVIIADIGRSYYEANPAGNLGLVYTKKINPVNSLFLNHTLSYA